MQRLFVLTLLLVLSTSCNSSKEKELENIPVTTPVAENDLDEINKQIINNPESPNGFYKRAVYYAERQEFKKALEDIDRALKWAPETAMLHYTKAEILFYSGNFETCKIYLDETLNLDPKYVDAMILKGRILMGIPQLKEAFTLFNEVLRIDPYNADAYFYKGIIFEETEQYFEAINSYHTATEQNSDYYDAYIRMANLYSIKGDRKGIEALTSAIAIKPNSVEAWRNKGLFHLQFKEYEDAYTCFKKTVDLDSNFELGYFDMGVVYIQIYDYKPESDTTLRRAIEFFSTAYGLYEDYDQAYYNEGLCYEYLKEYENAEKSYRKALEVNSEFKPARDALNILRSKK